MADLSSFSVIRIFNRANATGPLQIVEIYHDIALDNLGMVNVPWEKHGNANGADYSQIFIVIGLYD